MSSGVPTGEGSEIGGVAIKRRRLRGGRSLAVARVISGGEQSTLRQAK